MAPVLEKVAEELDEVRQAVAEQDLAAVAEEVGDLLFCVVNLARHLKIDAETALRDGNTKFERRFRFIEARLAEHGESVEQAGLGRLDQLWDCLLYTSDAADE